MKYIIIFFCLAVSQSVGAQMKQKYLIGLWSICNENNFYYESDTIELHQDINYQFAEHARCCHFINWRVTSQKKISIETVYACLEPGRLSKSNDVERIKLLGSRHEQYIEISRNGKLIDRFKILKFEHLELNRYPYETKILLLKREASEK